MVGPILVDRRGFLARLLGLLVAGVPGFRSARAVERGAIEGRIRAPGGQVRWVGPRAVAWFVHRANGRERSRRPVSLGPEGTVLVGMPLDGRLDPGEHEFLLEVGGRRFSCGGFRVLPFRFGC